MSKQFKMRPSQVLSLTNDYEAFCFDEACALILKQLEDGKEPRFNDCQPTNNDDIINFFNDNNSK